MNDIMLQTLQELSKPQAMPRPAQKDFQTGGSQFQEMMDKQSQAAGAESTETETKVPVCPQQEQPADAKTWQEQMVAAAMAAMAVSVVPVEGQRVPEQAVPQAEQPAVAVAAALSSESGVAAAAQPLDQPIMPAAEQPAKQVPSQAEVPQVEKPLAREGRQMVRAEETGEFVRESTQETAAPMQEKDQTMKVEVQLPAENRLFGEVRSVPVKVGESVPAGENSQPESIAKQVMEPLDKALQRGDSKVEIQLKPENLGTLKVELTRHGDGSLQVVLTAERPNTQALLEKNAVQLQNTLSGPNQEPVRVVVEQQESQQNPGEHAQDGNQGGQAREQRQQHQEKTQDFLQQLRLGLLPLDLEPIS